ncbi:MAG TPA: hypothetical protein VFH22_03670, partial [Rhodocyclaceae bacterium]|nr:hypothetical protein [Rhodocyclaceae bacterium]
MKPAIAAAPPRNGHRVVALIAALLSLPFVAATLLWQFGWQPGRQINHGELLATSGRPLLQIHESDLSRRDFPGVPARDSLRGSGNEDSLRSSHGDSIES